MKDFLESGLVYIPAWILGRWLCHFEWSDPFIVGWIVASGAVCIRWFIVGSRNERERA